MILAGLADGDQVPSARRLAGDLGTSQNTVVNVINRLRDDGLIRNQARLREL